MENDTLTQAIDELYNEDSDLMSEREIMHLMYAI